MKQYLLLQHLLYDTTTFTLKWQNEENKTTEEEKTPEISTETREEKEQKIEKTEEVKVEDTTGKSSEATPADARTTQ